MVRDGRLELPTSCSQSKRATNCANPGFLGIQFCSRCGQTCGQADILTTFTCERSTCIAGVSRDCGHSVFQLERGVSCSQMCVGTFSRHSSVLFGPFLCLGSSSLELFCPACFKKPFRLLGFVWDWILCIKRCSARFEGQWQAGSPQWRGAGIASHKQRIKPVPPAV